MSDKIMKYQDRIAAAGDSLKTKKAMKIEIIERRGVAKQDAEMLDGLRAQNHELRMTRLNAIEAAALIVEKVEIQAVNGVYLVDNIENALILAARQIRALK